MTTGNAGAHISVITWDDNHGNYLISPATIAQRVRTKITTTDGDVFTFRRSGNWVLRHREDSVFSPSIYKFEPCTRHWMSRDDADHPDTDKEAR